MRISDWSSDVCSSDLTGGSICHGQTGGEIVAAVQHNIRAAENGFGIVGRDALMDGGDGHVRGEPGDGFPCGVGLGTTNIGGCEQHLPLQVGKVDRVIVDRSEEHTSELQSLMRISYAVFC